MMRRRRFRGGSVGEAPSAAGAIGAARHAGAALGAF